MEPIWEEACQILSYLEFLAAAMTVTVCDIFSQMWEALACRILSQDQVLSRISTSKEGSSYICNRICFYYLFLGSSKQVQWKWIPREVFQCSLWYFISIEVNPPNNLYCSFPLLEDRMMSLLQVVSVCWMKIWGRRMLGNLANLLSSTRWNGIHLLCRRLSSHREREQFSSLYLNEYSCVLASLTGKCFLLLCQNYLWQKELVKEWHYLLADEVSVQDNCSLCCNDFTV